MGRINRSTWNSLRKLEMHVLRVLVGIVQCGALNLYPLMWWLLSKRLTFHQVSTTAVSGITDGASQLDFWKSYR